MVEIVEITSIEEAAETYPVMAQLRPGIELDDFLQQLSHQFLAGYRLVAVKDHGQILAVAGFRYLETLFARKMVYIDDLVTMEGRRSQGVGRMLLSWVKETASADGCCQLHLDSAVTRHGAHRFYIQQRLDITSYRFSMEL